MVLMSVGVAPALAQEDFPAPEIDASPFGPGGEFVMDGQEQLARGMHMRGPGMPGMSPGGGGPFAGLEGELALTDQQHEKLYELRNALLNEVGPLKAQLQTSQRELKDIMTRAEINPDQARIVQQRINKVQAAIADLHLKNRLGALAALTPDQRTELRRCMIKGPAAQPHKGQRRRQAFQRGFGERLREGGPDDRMQRP